MLKIRQHLCLCGLCLSAEYSVSQGTRSRQISFEPSIENYKDDSHLLESSSFALPRFANPSTYTIGTRWLTGLRIRQSLQGWHFGVLASAGLTTFVLVANCVAVIVSSSMYGVNDGISTAFEGGCEVVNRWSLGLHVVINTLSSLLLRASNYTMQVLNAPTRSECDKVHARRDWLIIGITSLRNVVRITWWRRAFWILLGVSSVPIHHLHEQVPTIFKQIILLQVFGLWYQFYCKFTSQLQVQTSSAALRLAVQCQHRQRNALRRRKPVPVQ